MMIETKIYIFKLKDGSFRGVEAYSEEQAREIAELREYDIADLVRIENIAINEGGQN